jgi:hypothetical protein
MRNPRTTKGKEQMTNEKTRRIAELNDQCRRALGLSGRLVQTQGICALAPEDQSAIRERTRRFDAFTPDNDPYGERDFGAFEHEGLRVFWKIDYYDPTLTSGSEDPSDPARLAPGTWCHRLQKTIGQGDVSASYSAMQIGMNQPVKKPFQWKGGLWLCVSMITKGGFASAEIYRLVPPQAFSGEPTTYTEKTRNSDAARSDPNGFYHGMSVTQGGEARVLCGPEITLLQGTPEQGDLFGC